MSKNLIPQFDRYAIFQTGGKQYQGLEGKTIAVEKLDAQVGSKIKINEVLLKKLGEDSVEIGAPYVKGGIEVSIVKHMRGPKIISFKFKRRKKYARKIGHRQNFTIIRVESL